MGKKNHHCIEHITNFVLAFAPQNILYHFDPWAFVLNSVSQNSVTERQFKVQEGMSMGSYSECYVIGELWHSRPGYLWGVDKSVWGPLGAQGRWS